MDCIDQFFADRLEVFRPGSADWPDPARPERPAASDCEQFAVSDPARPSLPNPGSRILSACRRRLAGDWMGHFSRPLLLEMFVDADFHDGVIYRADNWTLAGKTRDCRPIHGGCSPTPSESVKPVVVKPLHRDARKLLCARQLPDADHYRVKKMNPDPKTMVPCMTISRAWRTFAADRADAAASPACWRRLRPRS